MSAPSSIPSYNDIVDYFAYWNKNNGSSEHGVVSENVVPSGTDGFDGLTLIDLINLNDRLDDVESVYAFEGMAHDSDENSEVESVYAFDYKKTETDDVESVYAFEGMNSKNSVDTGDFGTESDEVDQVISNPTKKTETFMDSELYSALSVLIPLYAADFLKYFGYTSSSHLWCYITLGLYFCCLFSFVNICRNHLEYCGFDKLFRKHGTSDQSTDVPGVTTEEVKIDTAKTDEQIDEVCSVYAYDPLNDNETPSPDVIDDVSESVKITEGSSPFGFTIQNYGPTSLTGYHAKNCSFYFVDETVTNFRINTTGEALTFVFDGENLEVVEHDGQQYTSFAALPTKVADLLVTAHAVLQNL